MYDLSKKQKQMFVYLILCTSAQALTASIFTDSYRGKVKCQKIDSCTINLFQFDY